MTTTYTLGTPEVDLVYDVLTGRTALATAEALDQRAAVFPSHHGGFLGPEFGYPGQLATFAATLREPLAG